mmetsp:Transcript_52039/g.123911  ORF Transcript_52039/g.123911 Transcript_52039/m.123911 type:complete len:93 (+) Transcript_52039:832-1110(+)
MPWARSSQALSVCLEQVRARTVLSSPGEDTQDVCQETAAPRVAHPNLCADSERSDFHLSEDLEVVPESTSTSESLKLRKCCHFQARSMDLET